MKLQILTTIAAGLLIGAVPSFAQSPSINPGTPVPPGTTVPPTPIVRGNPDKIQDHAEHKEQWKDCMARMESKEKGMKGGNHHMGNGKNAGTNKSTGKTQPIYEPKGEGKGEAPETHMNRHEEMMQDCRNQLYGGRHEEPGGTEAPLAPPR